MSYHSILFVRGILTQGDFVREGISREIVSVNLSAATRANDFLIFYTEV